MPATVDFPLSAKRHWHDAVLLESNARIENAGQLYGFAAECGIKAILVGLNYPTDADGSPVRKPPVGTPQVRKHVHQLVAVIGDIQNYVQGRNGAKYIALIPNIGSFSNWDIEHRYWTDTAIPNSLPAWKVATKEVMGMLDAATLDGVLQ
jgi:hypothetical protein